MSAGRTAIRYSGTVLDVEAQARAYLDAYSHCEPRITQVLNEFGGEIPWLNGPLVTLRRMREQCPEKRVTVTIGRNVE